MKTQALHLYLSPLESTYCNFNLGLNISKIFHLPGFKKISIFENRLEKIGKIWKKTLQNQNLLIWLAKFFLLQ